MDTCIMLLISVVNLAFFTFVYTLIKNFCFDEGEEMKKYRKMTGLEIELLNKKIENLYGKTNII